LTSLQEAGNRNRTEEVAESSSPDAERKQRPWLEGERSADYSRQSLVRKDTI
jgi:hypothetical protein